MSEMTFQEAFNVFAEELRRDKELYRAYQANIAMAYYDCATWKGSRDSSAKRHAIGNRAADHFLKLLLTPVRSSVEGDNELLSLASTHKGEKTMPDNLESLVFVALGEASMCWSDIDKAGEFESSRCAGIGHRLVSEINRLLKPQTPVEGGAVDLRTPAAQPAQGVG